jgi:hypothetical protein
MFDSFYGNDVIGSLAGKQTAEFYQIEKSKSKRFCTDCPKEFLRINE